MTSPELNRRQALALLVEELDRVYPQGNYAPAALASENGIPEFVTARNGVQRQFSRTARRAIQALVLAWRAEAPTQSAMVDIKSLDGMLRQCVADLHADGAFGDNAADNLKLLKAAMEAMLTNIQTDFTHSFPACTLGMEAAEPFALGPVTFMTRAQWIDAVDFSEHAKHTYLGGDPENEHWKPKLKAALAQPKGALPQEDEQLPGLAAAMYGPLSAGRSVLRVSLSGYEKSLSAQAARDLCKTALDAVSLALGGHDFFHQQTLADERMPPVDHYTLLESNGYLWLPGMGLNKQIPILTGRKVKTILEEDRLRPLLEAIAHVLQGLTTPSKHPHPHLAMRWAVALDWLAEGEREISESIALTKIGTSLDVLGEGGKFRGILNMLTHLTGWEPETEFPVGPYSRTLEWLVKELYDHGRSKILHGNILGRLQSFADMRKIGATLARIALIQCAVRLKHYTGADSSKAFRDMPAPDPQNGRPEPTAQHEQA